MPTRSGAMQRPRGTRCGITFLQRYDEVGLPWKKTIGSRAPSSTYAIPTPSTSTLRLRADHGLALTTHPERRPPHNGETVADGVRAYVADAVAPYLSREEQG